MELSACSCVSKDRTLGNYSDYSARSSYVEMPKLGPARVQRDRRSKEMQEREGIHGYRQAVNSDSLLKENTSLPLSLFLSKANSLCITPILKMYKSRREMVQFGLSAIYTFKKKPIERKCLFSTRKKRTLPSWFLNFRIRVFLFFFVEKLFFEKIDKKRVSVILVRIIFRRLKENFDLVWLALDEYLLASIWQNRL